MMSDCAHRWPSAGLRGKEPERTASSMPSVQEIEEERRKVRRLQLTMDLISSVLMQSNLTIDEAAELVKDARRFALGMFPDKELAFEIIYAARFRRVIAEKFRLV
jgi:hypothetical protein